MPRSRLNQEGAPPAPGRLTLDIAGSFRLAMGVKELSLPGKTLAAMDCARLTFTRGILPEEYFLRYQFHLRSKAEQAGFLTLLEAQLLTWRLSREIRDVFWHKDRFLKTFNAFVNREWFVPVKGAEDSFHAFCRRHPHLLAKPRASTEGRGIRLLGPEETRDPGALFQQMLKEDYLLEEVLRGDERLAAFHPPSLNTLRVVTLYNGIGFHILGAVARFGRGGSAIDNVSAGGLYAELDPASGIIVTEGMDKDGNRYDKHPDTGYCFKGFQVPRWPEAVAMAQEAVKVLPNTRISGWDIAPLRDGGIALIEGNHMPDFDLLQQPRGRGIKKEFEDLLRNMFEEDFLTGLP